MGQTQSGQNLDNLPLTPINKTDNITTVDNAEFISPQNIANFVFEAQTAGEPVLLFVHDDFENPCSLIGNSLQKISKEEIEKYGSVAFVIGKGDCRVCQGKNLYWYDNGWMSKRLTDVNAVLSIIQGLAIPNKLTTMYHLIVDGNRTLKIEHVLRKVQVENGKFEVSAGCVTENTIAMTNIRNGLNNNGNANDAVRRVEKNMAETAGSLWWLWLIIIILVLLFLYWLYKKNRI